MTIKNEYEIERESLIDEAYKIERNSLIEEALLMAKIELKAKKLNTWSCEMRKFAGREKYRHYFYTEFFHKAMNQLAFDRGLVDFV